MALEISVIIIIIIIMIIIIIIIIIIIRMKLFSKPRVLDQQLHTSCLMTNVLLCRIPDVSFNHANGAHPD
jgi:hypothetical protein